VEFAETRVSRTVPESVNPLDASPINFKFKAPADDAVPLTL
jgi:hypothetical protein